MEKFNKPLLNDQDWLEPNSGTFDQILKGIDKPKKRKRFFWILVLALIIVSILIAVILTTGNSSALDNSSLSVNDPKLNNTSLESNAPKSEVVNAYQKESSETFSEPVDLLTSEISDHDLVDKSIRNSFAENVESSKIKTLSLSTTGFLDQEKYLDHETQTKEVISESKRPLSSINQLSRKSFSLDGSFSSFKINPLFSVEEDIVEPINLPKPRFIRVYGGANRGIHVLNSNYEFALAPADFYSEDKMGWQLGIGITKQLTSRVGFTFNAGYKNQKYTSGHNSEVIYNTALENNDHSQTYELTLATPFGFVQSDFVLSRSTEYQESATALDAIFGSSHEIHAINADLILDYAIFSHENWSVSVVGGVSLIYALQIENRLVSLDTQHDFIKYEGGTIEEDQSGISTLSPNLLGGAMFKRNLGPGQFFINTYYSHSATAFFRQAEFSSQLHSYNMDIGYQFRF